ncbi:hypothetical protein [Gluconobacter oxydans]|uniref:hypothetical protein n=1 Tax=Gluconobacter oxydans TaxID=442 RepID=UPI001CD8DF92|nr:hypothetical protein [Gluconobacter oxydans]
MTDRAHILLTNRADPLLLVWPVPGNPAALVQFAHAAEWRQFIDDLAIEARIPEIVQAKFARAQTLYLLGWIDISLVKAGELAALIALELALMDRYGGLIVKRKRSFATLLAHMVEVDGLTDADLPVIVRCGGSAIGHLTGTVRPSLAQRRNTLAHGDPFEGLPTGGLLELVRDLINFAYRHYLAEAESLGIAEGSDLTLTNTPAMADAQ